VSVGLFIYRSSYARIHQINAQLSGGFARRFASLTLQGDSRPDKGYSAELGNRFGKEFKTFAP
jgi:hypothetical protein